MTGILIFNFAAIALVVYIGSLLEKHLIKARKDDWEEKGGE